jgi:cardiolipin hydrolase
LSIRKARLDIAIYRLSDNDLVRALEHAKARGVAIRIISEHETADNQGSDVLIIKGWGVPVKIRDQPPALMHHKFAVVDGKLGLTGSFNWTRGARLVSRRRFKNFP